MMKNDYRLITAVFLATLIFLAPTISALDYSVKEIKLYTTDGYRVFGEYYFIPQKSGPTLLLLHKLTGDHSEWKPYLPLLSKAGVTSILAIDLRGHGGSVSRYLPDKSDSSIAVNWKEFSEDDLKNAVLDLKTAWDFLKECPSTDSLRMGIMGGSIGANYAAIFAAENHDVKSLAMISPGVVFRGVDCIDAVKTYGERAVLFIAAEDDIYSAGSCEKLKSVSAGSPAHIEIYKGDAHGTKLLDNNSEFEHFLSDWFLSTL
ncbi:MAG: alpha/beta hydrolase [candidate division Zixibacteria bacterium]